MPKALILTQEKKQPFTYTNDSLHSKKDFVKHLNQQLKLGVEVVKILKPTEAA